MSVTLCRLGPHALLHLDHSMRWGCGKRITPYMCAPQKDQGTGRGEVDTSGKSDKHTVEDLALSSEAQALVELLLQGESSFEDSPGLGELVHLGVAVREDLSGRYVLADISHARQRMLAEERTAIALHLVRMRTVDSFFEALEGPSALAASGVEFLGSAEAANALLIKAIQTAECEIRTAQPLPRQDRFLDVTVDRDIALLQRGLRLRTIYQDSARGRSWEREYVKRVSEHGAEVRTLASDFVRIILIDSRMALIADCRDSPPSRGKGFYVTNPGILAFIETVYEQQWHRANPWVGEYGRADEPTVTNSRQREMMRKLEDGKTLGQIATALGVSTTTINDDVKKLYKATGTRNHFSLGRWWAETPERNID